MNPHLQRGMLLFQQGRHELAADETRLFLSENPDDGHGHALLAQCHSALERHPEAEAEAAAAIRLEPDSAYSHYAMARVQWSRNDPARALAAIGESIRLEPRDPDYLGVRAALLLDLKRTHEALECAGAALAEDPTHVVATNVRASALVRLGRREEAGAALDATLAREPENSWTHANRGWGHLHGGDAKSALPHFQEALRLDPGNEAARQGIVEAIKARNPVYSVMLRYVLWMHGQSGRMQWAIIAGAYVAYRLVGVIGERYPAWSPVILPLQIAYGLFAWFSWTAGPLSNLLLRLNRYGRLALSPEQVRESNWVGLFIALALAFLAAGFLVPHGGRGDERRLLCFLAAGVGALLVIPVKARFNCQPGWPRVVMTVYAAALVAMGYGAIIGLAVADGVGEGGARIGAAAVSTAQGFLLGLVLSPWMGNALGMVRVRR